MIALLEAYKAGLLHLKHWKSSIVAGIIVGIVALPLAMAFAIASGVKPEQGIYTAIIAGLIVGIFGGTRTQIAGPTGAFVIILSSITAQHGVAGLQWATLFAGFMLCVMGLLRLGKVLAFIPYPVIVGFTSGIGTLIFLSQWKDFFGLPLSLPIDASFYQKIVSLAKALPMLDIMTTAVSFFSLLLVLISPYVIRTVPGPLVGMFFATLIQWWFNFSNIATIGSVFGSLPSGLPKLALPDTSQLDLARLLVPAVTIAILAALESLLSAAVADSISGTKHNADQELMGQGLSNIIAPLFGGFASTGAIARTVTSIRHGGSSPLAAIFHSLVLLVTVLIFAPLAAYIPLCTLSAILMVVAYTMSDIPEFLHVVRRAPWYDVCVMLTTFLLTLFVDLVVAVSMGVAVAAILFMLRIHQVTKVTIQHKESLETIPASLRGDGIIYMIEGPFFFGVSEKIEHALAITHTDPAFVVLRLPLVPFIDLTGLETLSKICARYHARGVKVYLSEARPKVADKITRMGILENVENQMIFETLDQIALYHGKSVPQKA